MVLSFRTTRKDRQRVGVGVSPVGRTGRKKFLSGKLKRKELCRKKSWEAAELVSQKSQTHYHWKSLKCEHKSTDERKAPPAARDAKKKKKDDHETQASIDKKTRMPC